jgi:hypothetical protein
MHLPLYCMNLTRVSSYVMTFQCLQPGYLYAMKALAVIFPLLFSPSKIYLTVVKAFLVVCDDTIMLD